jgi:hypothetical protein
MAERALWPLLPGLAAACAALAHWLHGRPEARRLIPTLPELLLLVTGEAASLLTSGRRVEARLAITRLAHHVKHTPLAAQTRSPRLKRRRNVPPEGD